MAGESQKEPASGADPSVLTTEALQREVEAIKDLIGLRVDGLKDVLDEKFESVEKQFELIERQRVEQKKDTKDAVDAALAAAKEAVQEQTKASGEAIGKSEAQTRSVAEQQQSQYGTGIAAVVDKIDDLKDRLVRVEQERLTLVASRNSNRLDTGQLLAIISTIIAIAAFVYAVTR